MQSSSKALHAAAHEGKQTKTARYNRQTQQAPHEEGANEEDASKQTPQASSCMQSQTIKLQLRGNKILPAAWPKPVRGVQHSSSNQRANTPTCSSKSNARANMDPGVIAC